MISGRSLPSHRNFAPQQLFFLLSVLAISCTVGISVPSCFEMASEILISVKGFLTDLGWGSGVARDILLATSDSHTTIS